MEGCLFPVAAFDRGGGRFVQPLVVDLWISRAGVSVDAARWITFNS